jgi:diadenosine tetraphosphatase ApaH/serine/threonine PP2A family protein phosphatase
VAWTLEHTDRAAKDFMRELPFDLRFARGEREVHLVHGSPRKVNEYLFDDKPDRLYERLAAAEDADALVFGHTHKPWIREFGGVQFVNCGSVGKPKDGDPRGAFAVLALDDYRATLTRSCSSRGKEQRIRQIPFALGDGVHENLWASLASRALSATGGASGAARSAQVVLRDRVVVRHDDLGRDGGSDGGLTSSASA